MEISLTTVGITIFNLILLWILMKLFLFKPINGIMEKREQMVKEQLDGAQKHLNDAKANQAEYEKLLKDSYRQADEIVQNAQKRAEAEYAKILQKAKDDAIQLMQKAEDSISLEKEKAMKDMQNVVANLAFQAAQKVIAKNLNTEDNRALVENFLNEEGVAS